jgi:polysaccharide biosynthesis protein PslH
MFESSTEWGWKTVRRETTAPEPRPRVLYMTHRVPYPPDKGDRIRNWHVLKALAGFADVVLATVAEEPLSAAASEQLTAVVREYKAERVRSAKGNALASAIMGGSLSEGNFFSGKLHDWITAGHAREPFDVAVISASSLSLYFHEPAALKAIPLVVDVVDVDSQKWFDYAARTKPPKRWLYSFEGRRVRRLERFLATTASGITLVSPAETKLFNDIVGREVAITATNGVDLDYFTPTPDAVENAVAFVGAMDYLPNVDAVTWFAAEIWPAIKAKHPAAEFRIIGRSPTKDVLALAKMPGVVVTGGVPDVRPHLAKAAVVVAPLRIARGLQNKVLEALAAGKAVVAGPPALAALKAVVGQDVLQATTTAEWAEHVLALLGDAERRRALGAAGRRFVEVHHDWETCLRPLTDRIRSRIAELKAAEGAA